MLRLNEWETHLIDDEKAERTIDQYLYAGREFQGMFGELTKKNMLEYKKYLLDNKAQKTAYLRVSAMNQYCKFDGKPECKVKNVKVQTQKYVENVPTYEEYKKLLNSLEADGDMEGYWMVQWLAKTGVRVSELVRFDMSCLETCVAMMHSKGKERKILIPQSLVDGSREYFEGKGTRYLFTNRSGNPITREAVGYRLRKYAKRYGIRKEVMHPHAFRHLFAKQFMESNGNLSLLSDLLGHEKIETTAIYARMSADEQRSQLDMAVNW